MSNTSLCVDYNSVFSAFPDTRRELSIHRGRQPTVWRTIQNLPAYSPWTNSLQCATQIHILLGSSDKEQLWNQLPIHLSSIPTRLFDRSPNLSSTSTRWVDWESFASQETNHEKVDHPASAVKWTTFYQYTFSRLFLLQWFSRSPGRYRSRERIGWSTSSKLSLSTVRATFRFSVHIFYALEDTLWNSARICATSGWQTSRSHCSWEDTFTGDGFSRDSGR